MSTDALTARVVALEAQVAALTQQASADSIQPNVFQIDPDGTVTALLTGALLLDEYTNADAYSQGHAVSWQDAATIVREWIEGIAIGTLHTLQFWSQSDADNYAEMIFSSRESGGAGTSVINAVCQDTAGVGPVTQIIDSLGQSSYLQGGQASPPVMSQPTRLVNTPYTPSATRPTLVVMSVIVNGVIELDLTGFAVGRIGESSAGNIIPITFLCPAGDAYAVNVISGAASISFTSEFTL